MAQFLTQSNMYGIGMSKTVGCTTYTVVGLHFDVQVKIDNLEDQAVAVYPTGAVATNTTTVLAGMEHIQDTNDAQIITRVQVTVYWEEKDNCGGNTPPVPIINHGNSNSGCPATRRGSRSGI